MNYYIQGQTELRLDEHVFVQSAETDARGEKDGRHISSSSEEKMFSELGNQVEATQRAFALHHSGI